MSDPSADPVPPTADTMPYAEPEQLAAVRAFVRQCALTLGLAARRVDLLALAVSELTTNTLQHTTGGGRVSVWAESGQLFCDVVDDGPTADVRSDATGGVTAGPGTGHRGPRRRRGPHLRRAGRNAGPDPDEPLRGRRDPPVRA